MLCVCACLCLGAVTVFVFWCGLGLSWHGHGLPWCSLGPVLVWCMYVPGERWVTCLGKTFKINLYLVLWPVAKVIRNERTFLADQKYLQKYVIENGNNYEVVYFQKYIMVVARVAYGLYNHAVQPCRHCHLTTLLLYCQCNHIKTVCTVIDCTIHIMYSHSQTETIMRHDSIFMLL